MSSAVPPGTRDHTEAAEVLIARLERAAFTRWHVRARVIVGSATFFDAFDALSLAFVLPVLSREWMLTSAEVGWLIAVGYFGQFAGALIFGALAERIGRVPSAASATALMSITSLGCALSGGFGSLMAMRLIQGIGVGGEMPVAAAYVNELSKARGRGRFFLLYELIFPIGLMAAGQIGALTVPTFGWQVMFLIGGIPGLVVSVLLTRLPESPRWLIAQGRLREAAQVIAEIEASAGTQGDSVPDDGLADRPRALHRHGERARWRELLAPPYQSRTVVVWGLWAAVYFITNGLNNWMPTLYNRIYGLDLATALRAATLTNVAQVVVLLGCSLAIDRIGRRAWTATCIAAGAVLLLGLAGFGATSVTTVVLVVTSSYALLGSVNAVLYLYTPEIYPTRMRALATGAATCWLRLASALGPLLVGYLVDARGPGAVFLMFGLTGLAGAVTARRMLETRNRTLEELSG